MYKRQVLGINHSVTDKNCARAAPSAADLWRGYREDITAPQISDDYSLTPYWVRQTPHGDLCQGIVDRPNSLPCNLILIRRGGQHRYLDELQLGQYAPCGCYLGAQRVIVASNYVCALALAHRLPDDYVVAAFQDWNLFGVICQLGPVSYTHLTLPTIPLV